MPLTAIPLTRIPFPFQSHPRHPPACSQLHPCPPPPPAPQQRLPLRSLSRPTSFIPPISGHRREAWSHQKSFSLPREISLPRVPFPGLHYQPEGCGTRDGCLPRVGGIGAPEQWGWKVLGTSHSPRRAQRILCRARRGSLSVSVSILCNTFVHGRVQTAEGFIRPQQTARCNTQTGL